MKRLRRIAAAAAALTAGVSIAAAAYGLAYGGTADVQLMGPGGQVRLQQDLQPGLQGSTLECLSASAPISAMADGPGAGDASSGFRSASAIRSSRGRAEGPGGSGELKGVWISYLEWQAMPRAQAEFQKAADAMLDNCASWGMNAVFLHAHSHTDAAYPSHILPWSKFVSGVQGKNPSYDPFGYLVQAAHQRGLQVHAWFNPYRVTGYQMDWDEVSDQNPAKQWLTDGDPSNDRWVLCQGGQYYLNPSVPQVQELVAASVQEVLQKYDVDGIHFDDYFYPSVDDSRESAWFDKPEYDASGSSLPIADWRRENVNQLVSRIYSLVKDEKPGAVFGISPQGYLKNLRSDTSMFVDIDRWMTSSGYIDYIMPQLYWGFEARTSDGSLAPYAFDQNLASWIALKQKGPVKLYLGLGMYRAGTNVSDHNEISEWLRCEDIMKRQVESGRASGQVSGFCFFSYSSFLEETSAKEAANLVPILK